MSSGEGRTEISRLVYWWQKIFSMFTTWIVFQANNWSERISYFCELLFMNTDICFRVYLGIRVPFWFSDHSQLISTINIVSLSGKYWFWIKRNNVTIIIIHVQVMRFAGRNVSPHKSGQTIITGVLEFDIETDSGHTKDKKEGFYISTYIYTVLLQVFLSY